MTRWGAVLLVLLGTAAFADLDQAVGELAKESAQAAADAGLHNLGVPEFLNGSGHLGGDTGSLGHLFADLMEEQLVAQSQGRFKVIERRRLNVVLQEAKVQASGLTDQATASELLGKIPGLDGMIVGSLTRTGPVLRATAKVVKLADASIVGVKSLRVPPDPTISHQLGDIVEALPDGGPLGPEDSARASERRQQGQPPPVPGPSAPYAVEILSGGSAKPFYTHGGGLYVGLAKDEVYQIRLSNRTDQRVGVALYIDGLNSLGQQREVPLRGRLWILKPQSAAVIRGWQMDQDTAREFKVVGASESLAARQHFTDQVGLIAAAFYPELPAGQSARGGAGTGEGCEVQARTHSEPFRRPNRPAAVLGINYDFADVVQRYDRVR